MSGLRLAKNRVFVSPYMIIIVWTVCSHIHCSMSNCQCVAACMLQSVHQITIMTCDRLSDSYGKQILQVEVNTAMY